MSSDAGPSPGGRWHRGPPQTLTVGGVRGPSAPRRLRTWTVALAVGLSGFAALLYEVVWVRLLGDVFGHTAHAVHTVLAVFFAGAALGSFASERVGGERKRVLRVYGIVELALAVAGLLFLELVPLATALHDRVAPLGAGAITIVFGRIVTGAALLGAATVLMGATYPLVVRAARCRQGGPPVATLYAWNTAGGAAGAWLTAFVLLPALGVRATLVTGAVANLVAAVVAMALARRAAEATGVDEPGRPSTTAARGPSVFLPFLLFGTGFAALALEVLWTRALDQVLAGTVYSFATYWPCSCWG